MQTAVEIDYHDLLVKLGVAEELLVDKSLNLALLYQRLHLAMTDNYLFKALKCTENWQVDILGVLDFDYTTLEKITDEADCYNATPVHYLAWTGNVRALEWIKLNAPEKFEQKDFLGRTPIHYALRMSDAKGLEWIQVNYPGWFEYKDNHNATPTHHAALYNNVPALKWIQVNEPTALKQIDYPLRLTPMGYTVFSGCLEGVEWALKDGPQIFDSLKMIIQYAASSGNEFFNRLLLLKSQPETLDLSHVFGKGHKAKIIQKLINALETNYILTSIDGLDKFSMNEEEKTFIDNSLSRNLAIKRAKLCFMVFLQGINQSQSNVSSLFLDIHEHIFAYCLPKDVQSTRVYNEILAKRDPLQRALRRIQEEITRLDPFREENNTCLGVPLAFIRLNSDSKINALNELMSLVKQGGIGMASSISTWENTHAQTLHSHRNLDRFFAEGLTRTEIGVKAVKDILGIINDDPRDAEQNNRVMEI